MITEEKVKTLENYIIGRIEDLENQNSNLQAQIDSLKNDKRICFMAFDNSVDLNGKYLIEIKDNKYTITKLDEKNSTPNTTE